MSLRPYPAAAWAAAGPYPGEVSVDSFGAKMEQRSVSDLYAGDVDPLTQAVMSPVRRVPPNGVLADPLWRCSRYGEVRSYDDYPAVTAPHLPAYRRNLDGPAYERTAYARVPLDFPLTKPGYLHDPLKSPYYDENFYRRDRRSGYLDDPLYPSRQAFVDDPLYRRAALVDDPRSLHLADPLYRRAALVDDPLYARSLHLDDPLYRRSALMEDPLYRRSGLMEDPLYRRSGLMEDPLYRRSGLMEDPLYRRSGLMEDPLYRRSALLEDPLSSWRSKYADDPLYRRASFLDGPAYRRTALDDPVFGRGRSLLDRRVRSSSPRARIPVV